MGLLKKFIICRPRASQRLLEMLPGFVSWNLILFPVWGAFFFPEAVAYYLFFFSIYWLYRSLSIALRMLRAHFQIKRHANYPFIHEVKKHPLWQKVYHVVVIPTYKEPGHTLVRTLESLANQDFPAKKIIPVIAFEERAGQDINDERETLLRAKFENTFARLMFTRHPCDIPGEVKGKSSNAAWAAKKLNEELYHHDWDENYLTISSCDADVVFHTKHFAAVTQRFLTTERPHREIWQGALMFYNNIEKIPLPMKVFSRLTSVFNISTLVYSKRLINFSTYTLSWKLLKEVGYWDVDVIPEDYRLFFKAYFHTGGEVNVEPIFLPVFADAAESRGFIRTFINTYEQVKRWAWGASDDAYIIKKYILDKRAPKLDKTIRVFNVLQDHFLWPVNWFVLTVGTLVPKLLYGELHISFFGQELAWLSFVTVNLSLLGMLAIIYVDLQSRPACKNFTFWRKVLTSLGFVLVPFIGFFFTALPGLNAHTRLMIGRYLEYRVTEKI